MVTTPPKRREAAARGASSRARWRLRPQGDRCLSIDLGGPVEVATARTCAAMAQALRDAGLPGVTDIVPSFNAVAVHFRPLPDEAIELPGILAAWVERHQDRFGAESPVAARTVEIPVCYGGGCGPDLDDVAATLGMTPQAVVDLHAASACTVLMIGFAPGHPYIGLSDPLLRLPRRGTPRVRVEPGSVAIANCQTVIYPTVLPSGWHVIGRTPLTLFDVSRAEPALLSPGDQVRFVPVSQEAFERLSAGSGLTG